MAVDRFPVEAGHIMCFARAVGDPNPAYYEAMRNDRRVPAPPTFVQAGAHFDPEYLLRPKPGEAWFGSGLRATGTSERRGEGARSGSGLHAEQHFTYHRPVGSGDVLSATVVPGATWEKRGRRGGLLRFVETITDYRDVKGELVVTSRSVSVRTEKVVEGDREE